MLKLNINDIVMFSLQCYCKDTWRVEVDYPWSPVRNNGTHRAVAMATVAEYIEDTGSCTVGETVAREAVRRSNALKDQQIMKLKEKNLKQIDTIQRFKVGSEILRESIDSKDQQIQKLEAQNDKQLDIIQRMEEEFRRKEEMFKTRCLSLNAELDQYKSEMKRLQGKFF